MGEKGVVWDRVHPVVILRVFLRDNIGADEVIEVVMDWFMVDWFMVDVERHIEFVRDDEVMDWFIVEWFMVDRFMVDRFMVDWFMVVTWSNVRRMCWNRRQWILLMRSGVVWLLWNQLRRVDHMEWFVMDWFMMDRRGRRFVWLVRVASGVVLRSPAGPLLGPLDLLFLSAQDGRQQVRYRARRQVFAVLVLQVVVSRRPGWWLQFNSTHCKIFTCH